MIFRLSRSQTHPPSRWRCEQSGIQRVKRWVSRRPRDNGCVEKTVGRRRVTRPAFGLQSATGETRGPSGGALIMVMKATDLRDRNNVPARWGLYLASMGAVIVE